MRCYKCEKEDLLHLFHDGGEVAGDVEMVMGPYRGSVRQLPRDNWNRDASVPVVLGERITDDLVRSIQDES